MPLRNGMLTINELRHLSQKHLQAAAQAASRTAGGNLPPEREVQFALAQAAIGHGYATMAVAATLADGEIAVGGRSS